MGIKGSENSFGEPERRLIAKKAKREERKKGQRRVKKGEADGEEVEGEGRGEGIDTDWSGGRRQKISAGGGGRSLEKRGAGNTKLARVRSASRLRARAAPFCSHYDGQ